MQGQHMKKYWQKLKNGLTTIKQIWIKQPNSTISCWDIDPLTSIPQHLWHEWESYLDVCASLDLQPSLKKFLRYNELYPYK